jgi:hypothetical protein
MAFTAPVTRATDFLVTAAIWNDEHVDNFNTAVTHLEVRKPSDEPLSSSTVLQDDDHLRLPLVANGVYHVRFGLRITGGAATSNIKIAFTFPTSCQIALTTVYYDVGGAVHPMRWITSTSPSSAVDIIVGTIGEFVPIEGLVVNGSNTGTLILQWAQNTSNGSALVMNANSTLWAVKLA